MPNQPPLNPDALENAVDIIWMNTRGESGICDADRRTDDFAVLEAITSVAIKEYLAVAQPEVNSVEELDALPAGTLVKSGGREFYKTSYVELPWILPYGVDRFGSSYLAKHSKVTVIHRPAAES